MCNIVEYYTFEMFIYVHWHKDQPYLANVCMSFLSTHDIHSVLLRVRSNITKQFLYFEGSIKQHYNTYSNHIILNVICIGIWKMNKWERINELEVQDPEDMMEFSVEDLTWTEVWGDQVAIIPYCWLEDFISGEQSNEPAPTQFVVHTRRSTKVEDIKETNFGTYLDYAMWVFIIYFQYILNFWVQ